MGNLVYIATSIDGYIADRNRGLDWLETVPNPQQSDLGFQDLMNRVDALVMGRNTFETVLGFGIEWPYIRPVFVCSKSLKSIPEVLKERVSLIQGSPESIVEELNRKGYRNLYIDGGLTIQAFLRADLIDEMIISTIPVLLGGGIPLFGTLPEIKTFDLISSEVLLGQIVSSRYGRVRVDSL
ncbi:MAG: dihydrofolate reductase family protein [Spirochaetales bacterium]|nr:dihydrofolate reductase family protein [Spirochaetales bacterium]